MPHDNNKPFIMNFYALIHDTKLTPTNREVFSLIHSLTHNDKECCYASDRYLADILHVSPSTVQKSIHKLRELGYIIVHSEKSESGYGAPRRLIFINEQRLIYTGK